MDQYLYLGLMLFTISYPLAQSFEHRLQYASKWKFLFPGVFLTAAFFVVWDHIFTVNGVWGFNERYILGTYILSLPIEEWMFFFFVPFSCVFIHEALAYFVKADPFKSFAKPFTWILAIALFILSYIYQDQAYTFWNFLFGGLFLIIYMLIFKGRDISRFYLTYLVHLIPFILVNSVLTGSFIEEPVVWYNNEENLSIRLFTIPIEDSIYSMLLLFMNLTFYEFLKSKKTILTA
ncbi:lycopene cyclase domain-containing protein [Penaeicola halotolerans]|uniref:lycopene cyclase domain-containing protein n=1 Tax=Penaeicola halotolerans TaxID=2793196 RepID=UPI001CF865F8|nr:lycopene cyclase domain-containing protein [Penaeicola halotolerans]